MKTIRTRLEKLEVKADPAKKRLPVLVQQGPNQEAELAAAIKEWGAAELDTPENCAKWLG